VPRPIDRYPRLGLRWRKFSSDANSDGIYYGGSTVNSLIIDEREKRDLRLYIVESVSTSCALFAIEIS
jgi:hypothetical protein